MAKKKGHISENSAIDLEGIIIPMKWDEDGNPTAVALATSKEEEFLVNMRNARGRELLDYLQRKVKITGWIDKLDNNQKMITIRRYLPVAYDRFVPYNTDGETSL